MIQPRRPHHPTAGGYARGDETRQRIVESALTLFGERGYEGASTRDIATAAGVNAPALQYYFQNKEGVYRACAEHLIEELKSRFAGPSAQTRALLAKASDRASLIDVYLLLQSTALDLLLSSVHVTYAHMFSRELAGEAPEFASSLLDQQIKQPMNKLTLALLARIMGTKPNDSITRIRLLTLKGQMLAFHYPPGACLQMLNCKSIDSKRAAMIKQAVAEQTRIVLETWANAAEAAVSPTSPSVD